MATLYLSSKDKLLPSDKEIKLNSYLSSVVKRIIKFLDKLYSKTFHYANTPMKYTAIFHGCKNVNFQIIKNNIFLIFAQNIDCGYTLEPPH